MCDGLRPNIYIYFNIRPLSSSPRLSCSEENNLKIRLQREICMALMTRVDQGQEVGLRAPGLSHCVCVEKADPGMDWDWNNALLHKEHTKKLMHRERLSHYFTLIFVIPKKCSLFFNNLKRWRTQHGTVPTIRLHFKEQLRLMLTSFLIYSLL